MQVFISWSGTRSQAMAAALHRSIPRVLQSARPWMSKSDIRAGSVWSSEIRQALNDSKYCIACLTADNVSEPWLHFEAGAIAHRFEDTGVCPLLLDFDLKALKPPLSQFQGKRTTKADVSDVFTAINALLEAPLGPAVLSDTFDAFWPELEQGLLAAAQVPTEGSAPKADSPPEVLTKLLEGVQSIERTLEEHVVKPALRRDRRDAVASALLRRVGGIRALGTVADPPSSPPSADADPGTVADQRALDSSALDKLTREFIIRAGPA